MKMKIQPVKIQLWDTANIVLRGRVIALPVCISREEKSQFRHLRTWKEKSKIHPQQ